MILLMFLIEKSLVAQKSARIVYERKERESTEVDLLKKVQSHSFISI